MNWKTEYDEYVSKCLKDKGLAKTQRIFLFDNKEKGCMLKLCNDKQSWNMCPKKKLFYKERFPFQGGKGTAVSSAVGLWSNTISFPLLFFIWLAEGGICH